MTFRLKELKSDYHRVSEAVPLRMAQSWPWGSQMAARKKNTNNNNKKLSHPRLSQIEQECQESLIQGKIHIQLHSNKGLKYL